MKIPKRRGSFIEIGNGKFGQQLQDAYEEAADAGKAAMGARQF